jgi:hypothetical protein
MENLVTQMTAVALKASNLIRRGLQNSSYAYIVLSSRNKCREDVVLNFIGIV